MLRLVGITRFPVKSCRGEALATAAVEPWGLAGDRRWMLIDAAGEAATAREYRRLLLVRPEMFDGGLHLSAPGTAGHTVALPRSVPTATTAVTVHRRGPYPAVLADPAAHAWFSDVVGAPLRLVFQPDPTSRPTDPAFGADGDRVSLADGYPLLVTTEDSLAALNAAIAAGALAGEGPLPMTRFRPNLVVAGAPAWAEDGWRRLRIGDAVFRAVKGCDRCVMTTLDPDTAAAGKEPIATLARIRRWDGATWFGMNLVPDSTRATVRTGDPVEILAAVPAPDGPPR